LACHIGRRLSFVSVRSFISHAVNEEGSRDHSLKVRLVFLSAGHMVIYVKTAVYHFHNFLVGTWNDMREVYYVVLVSSALLHSPREGFIQEISKVAMSLFVCRGLEGTIARFLVSI